MTSPRDVSLSNDRQLEGLRGGGELKPCPFCGGKARCDIGRVAFEDAEIGCEGCGTSGPNYDDGFGRDDNKRLAISAWNTRTDSTAGLIEAARAKAFEEAALVAEEHAAGCAQARGNAGAMNDRHAVWQMEAERLASLSIASTIRAAALLKAEGR